VSRENEVTQSIRIQTNILSCHTRNQTHVALLRSDCTTPNQPLELEKVKYDFNRHDKNPC